MMVVSVISIDDRLAGQVVAFEQLLHVSDEPVFEQVGRSDVDRHR